MSASTGQPARAIDREAALSARPAQTPAERVEDRRDGGCLVTIRCLRPRWQRWLGGGPTAARTFGLDAVGREVYEACDGRRSVREIVADFAAAHSVSPAEAELSVTAFLRTLVAKGVAVIAVCADDECGEA